MVGKITQMSNCTITDETDKGVGVHYNRFKRVFGNRKDIVSVIRRGYPTYRMRLNISHGLVVNF